MARVNWTAQALEDLDAVCLFIARDAPRYAELLAGRMFEAADVLGEFPNAGRIVPEIGRSEIRELIVQNYRLIYRTLADEIDILTVHHGARLVGDFGSSDSS